MHHPERLTGAEAVAVARSYVAAESYAEAGALMRAGAVGDVSSLGVSLTLAWGEHDTLVRRPRPERIPAGVTQVDLPGCGHVPTWDAPELVADVILAATRAPAPSCC